MKIQFKLVSQNEMKVHMKLPFEISQLVDDFIVYQLVMLAQLKLKLEGQFVSDSETKKIQLEMTW